MIFEQLFNPVKIILQTPEEVHLLEVILRDHLFKMETKWYGMRERNIPDERKAEAYFLRKLHSALQHTPKQTQFSKC